MIGEWGHKIQGMVPFQHFKDNFAAYIISVIMGCIAMYAVPDVSLQIIVELIKQPSSIIHGDPLQSIVNLFTHNTRITIVIILLAVSFGIVSRIILAMNGLVLGMFCCYVIQYENMKLTTVLMGVLPHGIFEIPALILSVTIATVIGSELWKTHNIRETWGKHKKFFIQGTMICVSLNLIAAFIEATITPILMGAA